MKKIYTAFLALGLALAANAQIPTNGLIHHFRLDNDLSNAVSGATPLVSDTISYCTGVSIPNLMPSYTKDRLGRKSSAYLLRSEVKNLFFTCDTAPPKNVVVTVSNSLKTRDAIALGTGDRAIAFWAKMPRVTTSQIFKFHQGVSVAPKTAFGMDLKGGGVQPNVTAYTWGGGANDIIHNTPLDTNWHFYVITVENSTLYLNIDKVLAGYTNVPSLNTTTGNLRLGQLFGQDSVFIDNVMIYNRSLNLSEIDSIYADSSLFVPNCNLTTTHTTTNNSIEIRGNGVFFPMKVQIYNDNGVYSIDSNINSNMFTKSNLPVGQNSWGYIVSDRTGAACQVQKPFSLLPNGINDMNATTNVSLYPNPAKSTLSIDSEMAFEKVQIINILGAVVKAEAQGNSSIDIVDLQPGVYFAKLIDNKGNIITKKFIKE